MRWSRTPLEVMRVTDGGWTDTDTLLTTAFEVWERSRCANGCGHYVDEAWESCGDNDYFEVDDSEVCQACAAREQWSREQKDPTPGQLIRVVDTRRQDPDGEG